MCVEFYVSFWEYCNACCLFPGARKACFASTGLGRGSRGVILSFLSMNLIILFWGVSVIESAFLAGGGVLSGESGWTGDGANVSVSVRLLSPVSPQLCSPFVWQCFQWPNILHYNFTVQIHALGSPEYVKLAPRGFLVHYSVTFILSALTKRKKVWQVLFQQCFIYTLYTCLKE